MTIEQKAREIAAEAHSFPQSGLILAGYYDRTPAVEAARLGIIQGLEMALEIAEEWREDDGSLSQTGSFIGLAIRALIEEQKV